MTTSFLDHRLHRFLDLVAAREPAPGGGSVAAVTVSLAAALVAMAGRFSAPPMPSGDPLVAAAERMRTRAAELVDTDAQAYSAVLATSRATRDSEPDHRREQLRAALEGAAIVPLEIAELGAETARLAARLVGSGNPQVRGDAASAAVLAEAAVRAAVQLVRINVASGGCDEDLVRRANEVADVAASALREAQREARDAG